MRYLKIFIHSVGGRWFLLPSAISGLVALVTLLQGLGMSWIPDLSYWELAFFAVLPIAVWSIVGLVLRVAKLEGQTKPNLYFGNPYVHRVQLYETRPIATNVGVTIDRVPTHEVNVASVPLHNNPPKRTALSRLEKAHITIEYIDVGAKQLIRSLDFGRWADNTQLGQHDSPSSVDPLRYRDIEPNDGANLIDIALKYDADDYCCAFNSESWLEPQLKNTKWVLQGEQFDIRIIIKSANFDDYEGMFVLRNLGANGGIKISRNNMTDRS